MMNFYMTPGSCSTGIHILLEELEQIFSAHIVNLPAGDNQKPEFLAINPKGTIPVLVTDDGLVLTEFQAIAWWLALQFPKAKLLPESNNDKAQALDLMSYIVGTMHLQGFTRIFTTERYMQRESDREAVEAQGRIIVKKGFAYISQQLDKTKGYLFEQFSVTDAALFYVEFWAKRIDLPMPESCHKHLQLMQQRPVVQRVLAEEGYRI
ncbi:glutathione S-transferase [Alteromonadaceae bacterium 2753L.S.0a.02]|nr:glutathione S-transferase [Alteromonadaceae bacterium 2753L.S.0a.02]